MGYPGIARSCLGLLWVTWGSLGIVGDFLGVAAAERG